MEAAAAGTATCLENKSAVNCTGSIPPASVEILWVVSKAVMHPAFNRYQIGSTAISPTLNISALICVNLRLKIPNLEGAAVWTATGLEYQRTAKVAEVRLLHFPYSIGYCRSDRTSIKC